MTGWYRRFIRDYATLARPLTNLTKKECHKSIVAGMQEPEALEAFESLRDALMGPDVVLAHPDFSKRFRVAFSHRTQGLSADERSALVERNSGKGFSSPPGPKPLEAANLPGFSPGYALR